MLEQWESWIPALIGGVGFLIGAAGVIYCRIQMSRLEKMLENYSGLEAGDEDGNRGMDGSRNEDGSRDGDGNWNRNGNRGMEGSWNRNESRNLNMEETRESKLAHQLDMILDRAAFARQQADLERDQVSGLLSDLSHQLKTPLANVVMYTELLEAGGLTREEERSFLEETGRQARKMQWLMKAMMKASRLEHGLVAVQAGYHEIKETIGRAVTAVYAQAADKRITIQVEAFSGCLLYHDPVWTAEALGNILENGVKYSPEGSIITVRVKPLEIYTGIEIEDQGLGIAPEEYSDIFKRFYRGAASSGQEGNGLGLYLTQLILNKEKGYVTARPGREGGGSCFTVFLLNQVTESSD